MFKLFSASVFVLLFVNSIFSQTTDFLTNLDTPSAVFIDGDDVYVGEWNARTLSVYDMSQQNPASQDVVTGAFGIFGIQKRNNLLYFTAANQNHIHQVDLSSGTTSGSTIIYSGGVNPYGLAINGNDLYVAEYNGDRIFKIDVTATNPVAVEVVSNVSHPSGLLLVGNDLYISETGDHKISKIDITQPNPTPVDVVSGLSMPFGLTINGTELFIAELNSGSVSKININDVLPATPITVATGLGGPTNVFYDRGELYITEYSAGKISKITVGTLSGPESVEPVLAIHPDRLNGSLTVENLDSSSKYRIFNQQGQLLQQGKQEVGQSVLRLNTTKPGLYLIQFENRKALKFLL